MSNRAGVLLFLLIFASTVSFSADLFLEKFERPWNTEYKWPGNYSVVDYTFSPPLEPGWNAYMLQQSLDGLSTGNATLYQNISGCVGGAKANYTKAVEAYAKISEFTDYGLLPYSIDIAGICTQMGSEPESCTCKLIGNTLECLNVSKGIRYAIALRLFSQDYSKAWKGTIDNALDCLAFGGEALNDALSRLELDYDAVNYSGACDSSMSGFETCQNVSFFMNALETNGSAEKYREFAGVRGALAGDANEVHADLPKIEFSWASNAIWADDGLVSRIGALDDALAMHYQRAENSYALVSGECDSQMTDAENAQAGVELNELWRIVASPAFADIVGSETTPIAEKVDAARGHIALAQESRSSAMEVHTGAGQGYLRDAIRNMSYGERLANASADEFNGALDDAKTIVADYRERAQAWIAKVDVKFGAGVWPEKVIALNETAGRDFQAGEKAEKLGVKFEYYVDAILKAQEAYAVSAESEMNTSMGALVQCADVKQLIGRAKTDELDVTQEEIMLSILENSGNASEAELGCEDVMESITASAEYRYRELADSRAESVRLIWVCGSDCDDLKIEMDRAETGVVADGNILYPEAIGSLKRLRDEYLSKKQDASESIANQVGKYLEVRENLFVENAALDTPSVARLGVEAINNVDYPGSDLVFEIESAVEFEKGDAVVGGSNIRGTAYADGKLSIYMKAINASGRETFVFERNSTLLATKKTTTKTYGQADYTASIEETRDVVCGAGLPGFYVPPEWESLSIDGENIRLLDGYAAKRIDEGAYVFKSKYTVADAYARRVSSNMSTEAGNRVYYMYDVELTPALGMENLETFAAIPENPCVKEKKVITVSGNRLEALETADGFAVQLFALSAGKPAVFEVSYEVDNSSGYVESELARLGALNLSSDSGRILAEARGAFMNNQTSLAVMKLQELQEQITVEESELAKLQSEYDGYYPPAAAELKELEDVLETYVDDGFAGRLEARRDYLEDLVASTAGSASTEKVLLLKAYDKKWLPTELKAFKQNASASIGKMWGAYLDSKSESAELDGQFTGTRELYDRFEASGSLRDGYALLISLVDLREEMTKMESALTAQNMGLLTDADALEARLGERLKTYSNEYADAKGSRFESDFNMTPSQAQGILKQLEAATKKGDAEATKKAYNETMKAEEGVDAVLGYLEGACKRNLHQLNSTLESSGGKLAEKDSKKALALVSEIETHVKNEEWVKALKKEDDVYKIIAGASAGGNYDIVLWLSAVFVVCVAAVYYFKRGTVGKKPRVLRKLEKAV